MIVESGRAAPTPFARVMALLGPFGVVHGAGEWAEMFGLVAARTGEAAAWHDAVSVLLAATSFTILMIFAVRLAAVSGQRQCWLPYLPAVFVSIFLVGAVLLYVWPAHQRRFRSRAGDPGAELAGAHLLFVDLLGAAVCSGAPSCGRV